MNLTKKEIALIRDIVLWVFLPVPMAIFYLYKALRREISTEIIIDRGLADYKKVLKRRIIGLVACILLTIISLSLFSSGYLIFFIPFVIFFFMFLIACYGLIIQLFNMPYDLDEDSPGQPFGSGQFDPVVPTEETGLRIGLLHCDNENRYIPYRYSIRNHLVTIAQTRSGKGTTSIIPNLLDMDNPFFVIDPKGENAFHTIGWRSARTTWKKVNVLDPFNESKVANACYNPMSEINLDNAETECQQLAASLIRNEKGEDSFWSDMATSLLTAAIFYIKKSDDYTEHEKNLVTVYDKLLLGRINFIKEMQEKESSPLVQHAVVEILDGDDRVTKDVFSTIRSNLSHFLNDPKIRESLSSSSFSMYDLLESKADLFVVLPLDRLESYSRWLRLIVTSALQKMIKNPPPHINRTEDTLLMILDEFGNLGRLQILENAFTTAAGFNILLWPFIQDLSQLERDYPTGWRAIIGQAGLIEAFGIGELKTAEYLSSILGQQTIHTASLSFTEEGKRSINISKTGVPLQRPEDILKMDKNSKLIIRQGQNPIWVLKNPYYEDPELSEKWILGLNLEYRKYPELYKTIEENYPAVREYENQ